MHDSVQEFYSASFVKDQEEAKQDFYKKYINDWHPWAPELEFLKFIDQVAYNKYMLIPSFNEAFIVENNTITGIKKSFFIEILKRTDIAFYTDNDLQKSSFLTFITINSLNNWALNLYCKFNILGEDTEFQSTINEKFKTYFNKKIKELSNDELKLQHSTFKSNSGIYFLINAHDLLSNHKIIENFYESINIDSLYTLNKNYKTSKEFIEFKRKVGGIF
ncbi:hypothetical protein ACFL6Z_02195 [Pseudomonadota bacterium]